MTIARSAIRAICRSTEREASSDISCNSLIRRPTSQQPRMLRGPLAARCPIRRPWRHLRRAAARRIPHQNDGPGRDRTYDLRIMRSRGPWVVGSIWLRELKNEQDSQRWDCGQEKPRLEARRDAPLLCRWRSSERYQLDETAREDVRRADPDNRPTMTTTTSNSFNAAQPS